MYQLLFLQFIALPVLAFVIVGLTLRWQERPRYRGPERRKAQAPIVNKAKNSRREQKPSSGKPEYPG